MNKTNSYFMCEYLIELFFPRFVSNLKSNEAEFSSLHDYFTSESVQYGEERRLLLLLDDLKSILNKCNSLESSLVYFEWILGLVRPLVYTILLLFLMPISIVFVAYGLSFMVFFRKHWSKLKQSLSNYDFREACFNSIAVFWETQGAIFHGHEIMGLENVPDSGGALLIYYHAAMPIDFYYVYSKALLYRNRRMKIVADRFLFKVPGLKSLLELLEVTPGTIDSCVSLLKEGHIVSISPGGAREALFSDHNYEILWGERLGFAKTAVEAKIPLIPMFTKNCREALRPFPYFRKFFKFVYETTRLPLVPIYGFFPVKLVTFIGEPIQYDPDRSPDELKQLAKQRIQEMIVKHQKVPGSILRALLERFIKTKQE